MTPRTDDVRPPAGSSTDEPVLFDRFGRPLRDLRVSVTDRCNFRCRYCMPREIFGPGFEFLPRDEILTFEEITRVARVLAEHGLRKIRLTGGEPLLRHELPKLVAMLSGIDGIEVAMTTNGSLLAKHAAALAEAGLKRVTLSLDTLDDAIFREMNDADFPVASVLEGVEAASAAGLSPVKINAVVKRGVNDHTVVDLVRHFKGSGHIVRFIEYMDVGSTNGWRLDDVVSGAELVAMIDAELPIEPAEASYRGEVAKRYRFRDGTGEVGFITSVTQPFCGDCTRARLAADGRLYTCLFAFAGTDLRKPLRDGASDEELGELLRSVWSAREDRYSELRSDATEGLAGPGADGQTGSGRVEMSFIGG